MDGEKEGEKMTVEFLAFCRVLLRLLELGKVDEAIRTLKDILK